MTDWIDTRNRLPHDLKLKLVTVHNLHQGRLYVTVATYNPVGAGHWKRDCLDGCTQAIQEIEL